MKKTASMSLRPLLHGKRTLWLPAEARPVSFSVNGNIGAMGHRSGQISVIGFRV